LTRLPTVLVAGGGPAGLTLSRLLALRGWPAIVVDPLAPRRRRFELVGPSAVDAFRCSGIDDLLKHESVARASLGICRQWGADKGWRYESFLIHRGAGGYVVDREALDGALRRRAVEAGVVLAPGRFISLQKTPDGHVARIRTQGAIRHLAASLVIDATGRPSAVGRRLGAQRIRNNLQFAYPCRAAPLPPDRRAWLNVRGDETNWRYQLEGPDGLTETWQIGALRPGHAGGVDASTSRLEPPAGPGWIAVGDAASAFNPIWSEGLSNALGTATTVAGALLAEGSITEKVRDVYAAAVEQGGPRL
jgi:flavin-dependent dehydrogenase